MLELHYRSGFIVFEQVFGLLYLITDCMVLLGVLVDFI